MTSTFKVLAILLLAAGVYSKQCGTNRFNTFFRDTNDNDDDKIVGGTNAAKSAHPWQVSLRLVNPWTGQVRGHVCGGSILDNQWVITAAHCVHDNMSPSSWLLRFGEHDTRVNEGTEIDVKVVKVIKHESYNPRTINNDVALMKLATPLNIDNNEHINRVCLDDGSVNFEGHMCIASGWGHLRHQGTSPAILQEVNMPVINHQKCKRQYQYVNSVTDAMVCAGYDQGGKSVCQGDSGGPLVCKANGKYHLVGVTSWGVGCAQANYPGVFARVTTFRSWIQSKMASN